MKKILTAIAIIMCLALPLSAMAMSTVADNELSAITGQAGVSINVDVTAEISVGTLAWGDSDGWGTGSGIADMGFVGISGLDFTFHMSGRHDGVFANTTSQAGYLLNKPITIDVGSVQTTATGMAVGTTLVKVGIPTSEIVIGSLDTNVFVSGGSLTGGPSSTTAQVLGSLKIAGMTVLMGQTSNTSDASAYDAGYVTISAAGGGNTGVALGLNVKIDSIVIGTVSWGNTSSLLSGTAFDKSTNLTPGYIGVTGLNIGNVTINGGIGIGVATIDGALLGVSAFHATQVTIGIKNGTYISIPNAIYGTVKLAEDPLLLTNAKELGNFYINGVNVTFKDNAVALGDSATATKSIIQIWAH
jgi:hypothetical protein